MSSVEVNQRNPSYLEQFTLRPYFAVSTICNAIQAVVKAVAVVFSAFLAGLTFGQSSMMNKWCVAHARDCWISMKMAAYAAAGIFLPKLGVRLTESIDTQGVEELSTFTSKEIIQANFIEKCSMRIQFLANTIKEAFSVLICATRYFLSVIFKWMNFCKSYYFEQISFHEFFLFSGHFTCTLNSIHGAISPTSVTLMMVKG